MDNFKEMKKLQDQLDREDDILTTEILNQIGKNIRTVYGMSLVVGIKRENGKKYVHLKEHGVEDYYILLNREQWDSLVN